MWNLQVLFLFACTNHVYVNCSGESTGPTVIRFWTGLPPHGEVLSLMSSALFLIFQLLAMQMEKKDHKALHIKDRNYKVWRGERSRESCSVTGGRGSRGPFPTF